jgi:1-acyl-sn-glycerol-3-phosphate acyltransferase
MTEQAAEADTDSCFPARKPRRPRSMRWKAYVATWCIKVIAKWVKIFWRLDVKAYNKGSIPKGMPVLCVGNHLSFADPALWGATVSRNGAILAAEELRKMKFIGFFLGLLFRIRGDILVARNSDEGRQEAFDKADNVLANGGLVGGYAEGGIKRDIWRTGLFRLAINHEAAIVVIRLEGTDDFWSSTKADIKARGGKVFNRKARMRIVYSDPIYFEEYKDKDAIQLAAHCQAICQAMVASD